VLAAVLGLPLILSGASGVQSEHERSGRGSARGRTAGDEPSGRAVSAGARGPAGQRSEKVKANLVWRLDSAEGPAAETAIRPRPSDTAGPHREKRRLPGGLLEVGDDGRFIDEQFRVGPRFGADGGPLSGGRPADPEFEPVRLEGGRRYTARLPGLVRHEPAFVEIAFSGSARAEPADGTVINVDGAILGFRRTGSGELCELVARDRDASGEAVWRPTGVFTFSRVPEQPVSAGPFTLGIDPGARSWTLFRGDQVILGNLGLFPPDPRPAIVCDAGREGDTAVISSLAFLPHGPRPLAAPVMTDGAITLPGGITMRARGGVGGRGGNPGNN
jgi:hypothetical protein